MPWVALQEYDDILINLMWCDLKNRCHPKRTKSWIYFTWRDDFSETECQHVKASPTNRPNMHLDNTKKNVNIFFTVIRLVVQPIVDEHIILHRTAKSTLHIFHPELIEHCWTYIRKTDKTETDHSYFSTRFSQPCKAKLQHVKIGACVALPIESLI